MILFRSGSVMRVQVPISFKVRPQPKQLPVSPSTAQTLMHGETIGVFVMEVPFESEIGEEVLIGRSARGTG